LNTISKRCSGWPGAPILSWLLTAVVMVSLLPLSPFIRYFLLWKLPFLEMKSLSFLFFFIGGTVTEDDSDLSLQTLSNDLVVLLKTMYGDKMPIIFLVGHR